MILYQYKCNHCDTVFEALNTVENRDNHSCPQCHEGVKRLVTPVRFSLEGVSGHFPTATDRWIRQHEQEAKKERNFE